MAEKSLQAQIDEKEEEIKKLKAEQEELRIKALPQYPKHIQVPVEPEKPQSPTRLVVVNSKEEEEAALHPKAAAKADDKGKK